MTTGDDLFHAVPLAAADLGAGMGLYLADVTALGVLVLVLGVLLTGCLTCQTLYRGGIALTSHHARS